MYFNVDGEWAVAGVMSLVWWNEGSTTIGQYNTGGDYIRSTPINDWILSYATDAQLIPEPITLGLLGTCLIGIMSRRKRQ